MALQLQFNKNIPFQTKVAFVAVTNAYFPLNNRRKAVREMSSMSEFIVLIEVKQEREQTML